MFKVIKINAADYELSHRPKSTSRTSLDVGPAYKVSIAFCPQLWQHQKNVLTQTSQPSTLSTHLKHCLLGYSKYA